MKNVAMNEKLKDLLKKNGAETQLKRYQGTGIPAHE
ncbi:hypothetical protein Flavo103_09970 [Flavobacterium collinsii]|nr:hypothetical protein Flavo103_09970 [Flavobacterium collinsii]